MNGIDKIALRVSEEAKQEIDDIKKNADAQCSKIKSRYKELAQDEYWKIVAKGKKDADEYIERMRSIAQTDMKKQMLAVKQEMFGKAFDMALEKILSMPEEEYVQYLISLAVKAAGTGKEKIILSPSDRARYGKKVAVAANEALAAKGKTASLTLSEQTRDIRGGLILVDGRIETNCSIEKTIELRRNELSGEVAKLLFD